MTTPEQLSAETESRCEAKFWSNGRPCHHRAKYVAYVYPKDATMVCGIHARGFMRPIPLSEFDGSPDAQR